MGTTKDEIKDLTDFSLRLPAALREICFSPAETTPFPPKKYSSLVQSKPNDT